MMSYNKLDVLDAINAHDMRKIIEIAMNVGDDEYLKFVLESESLDYQQNLTERLDGLEWEAEKGEVAIDEYDDLEEKYDDLVRKIENTETELNRVNSLLEDLLNTNNKVTIFDGAVKSSLEESIKIMGEL